MSPRPRSSARAAVIAALLGSIGPIGATGCIIPDSGIVVDDEFLNPGAVRIVEPTPISPRANEKCDELTTLGGCPNLDDTVPSGLIRPLTPLCSCDSGTDVGLLGAFEIFVEDPDTEGSDPKDEIFGAFFLDKPSDPGGDWPRLAYTNLLSPDEPAQRYRPNEVQTIERPDPHLKAWTIGGQQSRVDLCNVTDDGTALEPDLYELRLIVTDRPWFRPVVTDDEGEVVRDDDGEPLFREPLVGTPDLAAGATYDTTTYVFECRSSDDPECGCEV